MTGIAALMSQNRDRLDTIFADFRKARGEKAMYLFSQFESGLRAHMAWEEEILFPSFEERAGMNHSDPMAVMRVEHERIRELLLAIKQEIDRGCRRIQIRVPETGARQTIITDNINRDAMNASAKDLLNVLGPHNDQEESVLYLSLERILTEQEQLALIERMQVPLPDAQGHVGDGC